MTTTFSIRFKQCLKEKNIKQAELARSTKITPSSISDWSKGKYVPKRDKLLAIAEFLEVNPDWLVGESDNGIFDGNLVFIRQQSSVRNGKIAAVRLTEWNEASLKKIFVKNDNVILYPCNPEFEPIVTRNVEIIGECVGVYREL